VNPEEFRRTGFDPKDLVSSVIAFPLLKRMQQDPTGIHRVLIALHNGYGDPKGAAKKVRKIVDDVFVDQKQDGEAVVTRELSQYVVARLTADTIRAVVQRDRSQPPPAIYQMWPDFDVHPLIKQVRVDRQGRRRPHRVRHSRFGHRLGRGRFRYPREAQSLRGARERCARAAVETS